MVKIKIPGRTESDVSRMNAKGWAVSIFRGKNIYGLDDFITIEKGSVKFWIGKSTILLGEIEDKSSAIEIKKYIDGKYEESKIFYDTGDGLAGTIFITDNKIVPQTYAFFRNASLMGIIDEFSLRRIEFPKTSDFRFEKTIVEDLSKTSMNPAYDCKNGLPPFHTDGNYEITELIDTTDEHVRVWLVSDASYIYEYNSATLTIPQVYDVDTVRNIMNELTQ